MKKILLIGASLIVSAFAFAPQSQATQWCFYGSDSDGNNTNNTATLQCNSISVPDTGAGANNFDTNLSTKLYKDTTGTYTIGVTGGYDSTLTNGLVDAQINSTDRSLLENNRGSGEQGLGLQGGFGPELDNKDGSELIFIDLGANYAQFTNWKIEFQSVDISGNGDGKPGEGALVFTSNNSSFAGVDFTTTTALLDKTYNVNGFTNGFYSLTGVQRYLVIFENFKTGDKTGSASNDDILVASVTADQVPEPALGFLLGGSLMALGLLRRKQK